MIQPAIMSFEEFLGSPNIVNGQLPDMHAAGDVHAAVPVGEGRCYWHGYNQYRIHASKHASDARANQIKGWKHGTDAVVAVFEEQNVGLVRRHLLWIHPEHRGRGLGTQLHAELFMMMGAEKWRRYTTTHIVHTVAGHENCKRAYKLLVERGLIEEPTNV